MKKEKGFAVDGESFFSYIDNVNVKNRLIMLNRNGKLAEKQGRKAMGLRN